MVRSRAAIHGSSTVFCGNTFEAEASGVRGLASSVVWRYTAIGVQFLIVLLVARRLSVGDAGHYFSLFGVVTVTAIVGGFGLPDGAVRFLPLLVRQTEAAALRRVVLRVLAVSAATCVAGAAMVMTLGGVLAQGWTDAILVGLWWMAYALLFVLSQLVTGLGRAGLGAFTAYSAANLAYLITLVPYLVLAEQPDLTMLLFLAIVGTTIAVAIAGVGLAGSLRTLHRRDAGDRTTQTPSVRSLAAAGVPMTATRLMQAALPWTPVWALAILNGPEAAATFAAASRLTVAVTAVIAALRFAVRPRVVVLFADRGFDEIGQLSRRCSAAAAVPPSLALVGLVAVGDQVVPSVLGAQYSESVPILIILMFGVLAEALGGIVDEILKMIGLVQVVIVTLGLSLAIQVLGCALLAPYGPVPVAWTTVAAFFIQYVGQLVWLGRRSEVVIWRLRRHVGAGAVL